MAITASQVKELREKTDCGMMDCKKALVESDGDMEKAIDILRMKGISKAAKRAGKIAAEGVIVIRSAADNQSAIMLEINCETDFVARDENFRQFAEAVAKVAQKHSVDLLEDLSVLQMEDGQTIETAREALVSKLGEHINIRRLVAIATTGVIGHYVHSDRIGVLVAVAGGDENTPKDVAMHIAASHPTVVFPEQVDSGLLEREREICTAQAMESGKPSQIVEKMVEGRLRKFINEISLVGQPFVKDPNITVGDWLKKQNAEVESFVRFALGEGIEKKTENFAEEVMAQLK